MREVIYRKNSISNITSQNNAKGSLQLKSEDRNSQNNQIENINVDIKSPLQQQIRFSKLVSQENISSHQDKTKENQNLQLTQKNQLRNSQHKGRDFSHSGSKNFKNTKIDPFVKAHEAVRNATNSSQPIKCSSSLSQSRKNEKIIELNQKLLKSPNLVIDKKDAPNNKKEDQQVSNCGNRGTFQSIDSQTNLNVSCKKSAQFNILYKQFLENEDRQYANLANFGTFGGKDIAVQWTQNDDAPDSIKIDDFQEQKHNLNLFLKQNSEKLLSNKNQAQIQAFDKKIGIIGGASTIERSSNIISHPKLISSSTFSNDEIDGAAEDLDEQVNQRIDQKQNATQKMINCQNINQDLEAFRLSKTGLNQNHQFLNQYHEKNDDNQYFNEEEDEDDDDGGFLSDEVDERRSFTPQPRQLSNSRDHIPTNNKYQNNYANDCSQITIENDNNQTIMNLSKITKLNDTTSNDLKNIRVSKKQSVMLPTSNTNIGNGSHNQNNNTIFMGQQINIGANSQIIFQNNQNQLQQANISANNSFVSGIQALNIFNGVQTNQNNRQFEIKKPSTVLGHIQISKLDQTGHLVQDSKVINSARSGGAGNSVPLTARVNSNFLPSNGLSTNNQGPRVKSLQRQQIVASNNIDSKSGINQIYKSPVRNIGGNLNQMIKPRSAYGGDSKQNASSLIQSNQNKLNANNNQFGQIFIQNLRELSGLRNNPGIQQSKSKHQLDSKALSSNDLENALLNANNNFSRQTAQNQMAQNLRKTPGTSMGLMTSVKSQNNYTHGLSQYPNTANSFNMNTDKHHNSLITGLQAANNKSQQSHSFKHNLHALMAQKGSKCKCLPADFDHPDDQLLQSYSEAKFQNDIDIFTKNEQSHTQIDQMPIQQLTQVNLDQEFDEISMGSVGAGSDEVGSAQEHRPTQLTQEQKLRIANQKKCKKFCSSYCKRIGPREQRQIIYECLRIEVNQIEEGQVTLFKNSNLMEDQTFKIKSSFNKLQRYIIDAKWWAKWCDYTNFDQNDILLEQLDFNSQDDPDDSQRKQFHMTDQQLQNYLSSATNRRFESTQLYQKPPRIENEGLLEQKNFDCGMGGSGIDANFTSIRGLRENLTQHYDFEALYPSIWSHLYSWYSADTQIARYLKIDSFNQDDLIGSMGSTTLKQALAEGQFKDKNGKNKLKKMELDLYPSKLNSRAFKNQFYNFDDINPQKENENKLINSEQRKINNCGTMNTEPAQKDAAASTSLLVSNSSNLVFNLTNFNKALNQSSMEKPRINAGQVLGGCNNLQSQNLNQSPQVNTLGFINKNDRQAQSFADKRSSLQGFLGGRHTQQKDQIISSSDAQKKQKQSSVGPNIAISASKPAIGGNSGAPTAQIQQVKTNTINDIDFQQKRNSYSFNRKENQKASPKADINSQNMNNQQYNAKLLGKQNQTSEERGSSTQLNHKRPTEDLSEQAPTSLSQKLMSYFNNK